MRALRELLSSPAIDLDRLRRPLRAATVAFLGAPVAVFLAGCLRPAFAAPALAALAVALAGLAGGRAGPAPAEPPARVPLLALLLGLAPAAVLALISGAGGFGPQNWDWVKHEAVLRDLMAQGWPVRYSAGGGTTALAYYVAYYLPAAVTGKLAGWTAANVALAATSLAGTVLAALWVIVLARGAPLLCGSLLALFSGMDVLGAVLVSPWPPDLARVFGTYHLEWWAVHWQYSSTASLLYFAPGQAIGGWLLAVLMLDALDCRRNGLPLLALLAAGMLWSPFAALGALPLAAAFLLSRDGGLRAAARAQLTVANLGGGVVAAVLTLYYASRAAPLALPARFVPATTPEARGDLVFLPAAIGPGRFLAAYALFAACEFLVLWLLLLRESAAGPGDRALRPALLGAGAALLTLPLLRYGLFNDLSMRASIPPLAVLLVVSARVLRRGLARPRRAAIALVLAVGALYGGNLLRMHLGSQWRGRRVVSLPPRDRVRDLFQVQLHDPPAAGRNFVSQYLGSVDAPFFRVLARPSAPREVDETDPLAAARR
jgi:hypothetical protein